MLFVLRGSFWLVQILDRLGQILDWLGFLLGWLFVIEVAFLDCFATDVFLPIKEIDKFLSLICVPSRFDVYVILAEEIRPSGKDEVVPLFDGVRPED